jgi:hypothetical protein
MDLLHVWIIECVKNYSRKFVMSAHTDRDKAFAARAAYIADGCYGDVDEHFIITAVRLNWTGIRDKAHV